MIDLTTSMPIADVVPYFNAALTAAGMVPDTAQTSTEEDGVETAQSFDNPASASDYADVVVFAIDGDTDYVELQINDAGAPGSLHLCEAIQAFLQLPAGSEPGGCGASTYGDEYQLSVDATYALDLPTTKAQVEEAMAAVGFTVETAADETFSSFEGNGVDGSLSYYSADGMATDITVFVYVPVG